MEYHELAPAASIQAVDVIMRNATLGSVDLRIRVHDPTRTTWHFPPSGVMDSRHGASLPSYAPVHFNTDNAELLPALPPTITVNISFDFDSNRVLTLTLPVDAWGAATTTGVMVPNPTLWSPESPGATHTVHVAIVSPAPAPAAAVPESIIGEHVMAHC